MNPRRALCCHSQVTLNISNPFEGNEAFLQHTAPAPQSLHSAQDSSKPDLKPTEIAHTLPATHKSTGSWKHGVCVSDVSHSLEHRRKTHTNKAQRCPTWGGIWAGLGGTEDRPACLCSGWLYPPAPPAPAVFRAGATETTAAGALERRRRSTRTGGDGQLGSAE